jgi:hypothetical protein
VPNTAAPANEDRGVHPAAGSVAQQIGPGLGGLAVTVGQGDEVLAALGSDADQHE